MAATVVVHPLDLLKNRMQLSGEGGGARAHRTVGHAAMSVFKTEGASGLYKGYIYLIQFYTYTSIYVNSFKDLMFCFSLFLLPSLLFDIQINNHVYAMSNVATCLLCLQSPFNIYY